MQSKRNKLWAVAVFLLIISIGGPVWPETRIRLAFGEHEAIAVMYDNPTSRDFLAALPLTVTLEDYAGTEKIARLEAKFSTADAPAGINPAPGDFTYYVPWGNLAIFYKEFRYSTGLVPLGRIVSGLEKLAAIKENFSVYITIIE